MGVASFPGLRPDFISQPWFLHGCEIKSGRRPGNEASVGVHDKFKKNVTGVQGGVCPFYRWSPWMCSDCETEALQLQQDVSCIDKVSRSTTQEETFSS